MSSHSDCSSWRNGGVRHPPSALAGLAIIPLALLIHNAEEALTIGGALPRASELAAQLLGRSVVLPTTADYYAALVVLTILGFGLYGFARLWTPMVYGLVLLQAVMAVNVVIHTVAAIALRGYVPGLVSAWLVEAPASWLVMRRVSQAGWMSRWQWWILLPVAIVLHMSLAALSVIRGL